MVTLEYPPPSNDLCQEGPLGIGAWNLAPFSQGEPDPMSPPHRWTAPPPACFEHRLPSLDGVVSEHPLPGLGDRVVRWPPVERANRHPLRVSCRGIGLELANQLLLITN